MHLSPHTPRRLHLAAASLALLFTTTSWAAEGSQAAQAQARFRQEMAVCNSGQSNQDTATCRLEARNALAEARRGGLVNEPENYQRNAKQRCAALAGIDRSACESRARGEGKMEGSVRGGGILRESVSVVPAN